MVYVLMECVVYQYRSFVPGIYSKPILWVQCSEGTDVACQSTPETHDKYRITVYFNILMKIYKTFIW